MMNLEKLFQGYDSEGGIIDCFCIHALALSSVAPISTAFAEVLQNEDDVAAKDRVS